jgi:phosphatidylserine/phosphatidylglycerophosphate/cardiolipin synthase-like enzyme
MARCKFRSRIYLQLLIWLQVHMTLEGTVVLDIIQHFVERWNYIKRSKVFSPWLNRMLITNEHKCTVCGTAVSINRNPIIIFYSPDSIHSRYEPLALPHNISVAANNAVAREFFTSVATWDIRLTRYSGLHEARGDTGREFR